MKVRFTAAQTVLTALSMVALFSCISADLFLMMFDRGTVSQRALTVNLIMSICTLLLSAVLIFKAHSFDVFGRGQQDNDKLPAITAQRGYFCMLSCDISGVMLLMLAGELGVKNAGGMIMIYAPAMFIAAALIYFIRVSRIGLVDFADNDSEEETLGEWES